MFIKDLHISCILKEKASLWGEKKSYKWSTVCDIELTHDSLDSKVKDQSFEDEREY